MGINSWSHEVQSPVSAPRLFKAALLDWQSLAPKLVPEVVLSAATVVQVDGYVGSIREFKFSPVLPFPFVKERLDSLDIEKLELKQSIVEGGGLGVKIQAATSEFKVEPTATGGCVCKVVTTFDVLPGADVSGDIPKAKETITAIVKAAEAYLLANPDAYN